MSIHKVIREGRLRLGLTEDAFAKLCGVTRGSVQQWEREGGTAPRRAIQQKVAGVLGITVPEMMAIDKDSAAPATVPKAGASQQTLGSVPDAIQVLAGALQNIAEMDRDAVGQYLVSLAKSPSQAGDISERVQAIIDANDRSRKRRAGGN